MSIVLLKRLLILMVLLLVHQQIALIRLTFLQLKIVWKELRRIKLHNLVGLEMRYFLLNFWLFFTCFYILFFFLSFVFIISLSL